MAKQIPGLPQPSLLSQLQPGAPSALLEGPQKREDYEFKPIENRDRQDVSLNLSDDKRKDVLQKLKSLIDEAEKAMGKKRKQWTRADKNYKANLPGRTFPWGGASNIGLPTIKSKLRPLARQIVGAIFRNRPALPLEPTEAGDMERVEKAAKFIDYEVRREIKLRGTMYKIGMDCGKYGLGYAKATFAVEQESVTEVEIYDGQDPDHLRRFLENYPDAEARYPMEWLQILSGQKLELDVSWKKTTYRGVRVDRVHPKSVIRPAGYLDMNTMPFYFEKMKKSWWELEQGVTEKKYEKRALDEIRAKYAEKPGKDANAYIEKKYDVYEGMYRYNTKGNAREKSLFTVILDEEVVLRAIKYPYKHGRSYLTKFEIIPDADSFEGEALAEDLADIQAGECMIFNTAVDSDTANYPTFKMKRQASGSNFDTLQWYPLKLWELDDIDDLQQMQAGSSSANSLQLQDRLTRLGDNVASISDLQTGKESAADPKAPAAKTQMLYEVQQQGISEYMRTFMEGYNEVGFQIIQLYSQYGTAGKEYRVLNEEGEPSLEAAPDDLRVRPDMEPHGGEIHWTQAGKRDNLLGVYQMLQQDPVYNEMVIQQAPQLWLKVLEEIVENWGGRAGKGIRLFIPSQEQIRESQVQIQMEAMVRLEQQKAQQAQQQAKMQLQQMMAQAQGIGQPQGMPQQGIPIGAVG